MRTSPYNIELRTKVIEYIISGGKKNIAVKIFKLNPSTINRWWMRYKKEGHYKARSRLGKVGRITKETLQEYILSNPNAKTYDIGKAFGMSGKGAFYWLKKLGYSYKKKPLPMWKLMKKSEINT